MIWKGGVYMDLDYFVVNPSKFQNLSIGTNLESFLHFRPDSHFMKFLAHSWPSAWHSYNSRGKSNRRWGMMGPKLLTETYLRMYLSPTVKREGLHIFKGGESPNPVSLQRKLTSIPSK